MVCPVCARSEQIFIRQGAACYRECASGSLRERHTPQPLRVLGGVCMQSLLALGVADGKEVASLRRLRNALQMQGQQGKTALRQQQGFAQGKTGLGQRGGV